MKSTEQMRRDARALKKSLAADRAEAKARVAIFLPYDDVAGLKLADCLYVIARENGFASWSSLKHAVELDGMDRAARRQRLKSAIYKGQTAVVRQILGDDPTIVEGHLGLLIALYDRLGVAKMLAEDPTLARNPLGKTPPLLHLAHSCALKIWPDREADMLAIAALLLANGADVNEGAPAYLGADHMLSPLYFAIGHADNMVLGRWLLEQGADPNDGESLYHATELGHRKGLELLLAYGADPRGTNALLRAMDFDDSEAVALLLAHGALVDDFDAVAVGGEAPTVIPALHQAARRMCGSAVIAQLLDAGADPSVPFEGCSAYGYARVFGNRALAKAIEAQGAVPALTAEEERMARAADGKAVAGLTLDPEQLPAAYRAILGTLLRLPDRMDQMRRLVALGIEPDRPDSQGLTPVQIAGWEGQAEAMAWLLELGPNLDHINDYGGNLLSTILHGADNGPERAVRDHLGCLLLALEAGVSIPRRAPDVVGAPEISEALRSWMADRPEQVTEGGIV